MSIAARDVARIEEAAFAALYQEHRLALHRFCTARTGDPDAVEDIVQDVFERAFAMRDRYDPARPFWPWIASIAARECIDTHRRRTYAGERTRELAASLATQPLDATSQFVLDKIDRAALERDIATLPPRQRTALLLRAVDGWSYADIADHLGSTVDIVKALIMRARARLRDLRTQTVAGGFALARALRNRLQQVPWSQAMAVLSGGAPGSWLVSDGRVVAVVVASLLAMVVPSSAPASRPEATVGVAAAVAVSRVDRRLDPGSPSSPLDRVEVTAPPTRATAGAAERAANQALAPLLPSSGEADTPETVAASDMQASPGYERDRTIFVSGQPAGSGGGSPLLVSRDGGASWHRLKASGLRPVVRLLLPPAYPDDDRLFALTRTGLQMSRDGGEHFETPAVLPEATDAAISPAFDAGDPSMLLVAGGRLFEYRVDTELLRPVVLGRGHAEQVVTSVAYGDGYPSDPTILVGLRLPSLTPRLQVSRCTRQPGVAPAAVSAFACADAALSDPRGTMLGFVTASGSDPGVVWAVYHYSVYVSRDDGMTFSPTRPWGHESAPLGYHEMYTAFSIAAIPSSSGASAVLAQASDYIDPTRSLSRRGPSLLRTDDTGRTWRPLPVNVPGFDMGAVRVMVTPTGRVLAAALSGGIACSTDDGRTWARACATPDVA